MKKKGLKKSKTQIFSFFYFNSEIVYLCVIVILDKIKEKKSDLDEKKGSEEIPEDLGKIQCHSKNRQLSYKITYENS
jgi:hypothetical protein